MEKLKKLPESLTKENFWDGMNEKYPMAMQKFCTWIDEYKKRVEWDMMFRERHGRDADDNVKFEKPKYHDLPLAMQIGIFGQFSNELGGLPYDELLKGSKRLIEADFKQIEKDAIL